MSTRAGTEYSPDELSDEEWQEKSDLLEDARQRLGKWTRAQLREFDSCLEHIEHGEPFFVLRAKDRLAVDVVLDWIQRARSAGVDPQKVEAVSRQAEIMDAWAYLHGAKTPD